MTAPLKGIKILDFSYLLPGPFATMMLADMGAEIVKVENPNAPDMLRFMPPLVDGVSAIYRHLNRGKKILSLDLKKSEAKEIVSRLIKEYDIVLEQFRPGVMDRLNLGYGDMKKINESIIYCSITGYGQTGSYADRAGHDINYMALAGVESFSGKFETGPALSGIQVADIAGGSKNAVIGILSAYIKRTKTGVGDHIDISMTDSVFSMSLFSAAQYLADGAEPKPESGMLNGGSLYDFYVTKDNRYLAVGSIEPKFLTVFTQAIDLPDLLNKITASPEKLDLYKNEVAQKIKNKTLEHWIEKFKGVDACVEPVRNLSEAVSNPPLSERDMIVTVDLNSNKSMQQIGNPIKFKSGHFIASNNTSNNTDEDILKKAGYSKDQISLFKQNNILS